MSDCVSCKLPPPQKKENPPRLFSPICLLSQSLKRIEGIKCKQISQQRVDMQMRNVTSFPEHIHRSFPQEEEYFANTVSSRIPHIESGDEDEDYHADTQHCTI